MRNDSASAADAVSVGIIRDVVWTDAAGRRWRRTGSCNRCGDCCRTGDPFAPRVPREARERPCTYFVVRNGVGECRARCMKRPPPEVAHYMAIACYKWPSRPSNTDQYERCGYRWEPVDGD